MLFNSKDLKVLLRSLLSCIKALYVLYGPSQGVIQIWQILQIGKGLPYKPYKNRWRVYIETPYQYIYLNYYSNTSNPERRKTMYIKIKDVNPSIKSTRKMKAQVNTTQR